MFLFILSDVTIIILVIMILAFNVIDNILSLVITIAFIIDVVLTLTI